MDNQGKPRPSHNRPTQFHRLLIRYPERNERALRIRLQEGKMTPASAVRHHRHRPPLISKAFAQKPPKTPRRTLRKCPTTPTATMTTQQSHPSRKEEPLDDDSEGQRRHRAIAASNRSPSEARPSPRAPSPQRAPGKEPNRCQRRPQAAADHDRRIKEHAGRATTAPRRQEHQKCNEYRALRAATNHRHGMPKSSRRTTPHHQYNANALPTPHLTTATCHPLLRHALDPAACRLQAR